jgi:polyhydroxyalkanoate synthesis regulator phasin
MRGRCYEYCEGSAVPYTDDREEFHGALRRLRRVLFGDDMYVPGKLKGEEARAQAKRDLRRMRDAFDAVVARSEEPRTEKADVEARVAELQEELKQIAASKARGAQPKSGGRASSSKTRTATSKTRPRSPKRKRKT